MYTILFVFIAAKVCKSPECLLRIEDKGNKRLNDPGDNDNDRPKETNKIYQT